ncbi:photosynthetic reaction center cytochrome PufC [Piscinibacterium candidicorallinum]|uniref:Photosynthetic reaction center cytochrome c subunit n=1 Tax=Piscinibacterium candidicorallinum TaxID=1793872 RepID=A0ABV7H262_9BURK
MISLRYRTIALSALVLGTALLAGCERPPVTSVQNGPRGTAMVQVYNPRTVAAQVPQNIPPEASPQVPAEGPKAGEVYQNVKVLKNLSVGEFTRLMVSITNWVAPEQGCTYCHAGANFADDTLYTKVVARKMIEMTQHINGDWKTHVANTGVTCYTCHRGNNVPQQVWFAPLPQAQATRLLGDKAGQNTPATTVGLSSLPYDPFTPYLLKDKEIRVNGTTALPTGNRQSTKQAEFTYGLMMHMSKSLGVNCTYCHNAQAFGEWASSPPQRSTAWHGIRMVRDINTDYLEPLTTVFPAGRLGPTGDVAKVNCTTCHQGAYKPLYGAQMVSAYPELQSKLSAAMLVPSVPPATATAEQAVIYFSVGASNLSGETVKTMEILLANLKANAKTKAIISGYHSASGSLEQNQELAKQRAFAVRDALKTAGIAESRIVLEKPVQTEANLAGEDPKARRVEVNVK